MLLLIKRAFLKNITKQSVFSQNIHLHREKSLRVILEFNPVPS